MSTRRCEAGVGMLDGGGGGWVSSEVEQRPGYHLATFVFLHFYVRSIYYLNNEEATIGKAKSVH